ncbi:MAG TPA: T9SS type A sorting domain-containing protein [Bacteroidia bacterium]|nr:T9SS type A sorting domain-containing protein [Bacteroidia bacterium]
MKHQIVASGILFLTLLPCFSKGQNSPNTLFPLGEASLDEGSDNERIFPSNIPSVSTAALLLPAPGNDNCANATALIVNGACTSGTLASASTQTGENISTSGHCGASNFSRSVWYRFTATASNMWVQSYLTGLAGGGGGYYPGRFTSVIYNTSNCLPSASNVLSCANMNTVGFGDGIVTNRLSGLTVNTVYLVQIGYNNSNGSQDPEFCIRVGDQFSPDCNTCATNCGQACGFATAPTVAQVTSACTAYNYQPYLEGGETSTRCHSFIASNTSVSFQVIVNTTCGSGNVSNFTWSLYNNACGTPIQTGTLSGMTFTGLTPGTSYTYCYTYTVPAGCYHTIHYPYFVGAAPLPINLLNFTANEGSKNAVNLFWITATETNNKQFEVQRSSDGIHFETIHTLPGAGNSHVAVEYRYTDHVPSTGTFYYRLLQTDFDGQQSVSEIIAVNISFINDISVQPNPAQNDILVHFQTKTATHAIISVYNQIGIPVIVLPKMLGRGPQVIPVSLASLPGGVYSVSVETETGTYIQRIIKL